MLPCFSLLEMVQDEKPCQEYWVEEVQVHHGTCVIDRGIPVDHEFVHVAKTSADVENSGTDNGRCPEGLIPEDKAEGPDNAKRDPTSRLRAGTGFLLPIQSRRRPGPASQGARAPPR